jgi:GNAT superfamily N-acetyltransferase
MRDHLERTQNVYKKESRHVSQCVCPLRALVRFGWSCEWRNRNDCAIRNLNAMHDRYRFEICSFDTLKGIDRKTCVTLLRDGGAVNARVASKQLPDANLMIVARSNDELVGVGAVKQWRQEYASEVSARSKYELAHSMHELGYVVVAPDHRGRGVAGLIVTNLTAKCDFPLFATTDDPSMKAILQKSGFAKKGQEWQGKRSLLSLWVRAHWSAETRIAIQHVGGALAVPSGSS